ncbi:MAG TPA: tetratricopeptide repeat protein [Candidatus Acidoferrum sp.]|nr:tetratricopeptide repeat protein [Candidatus Acidoferrum sp.]
MIHIDEALRSLDGPRAQIRGLLARRRARLWVRGPTGSGRTTLAAELEQAGAGVLVVPPGADELDGPIHGLYQLASQLPAEERSAILTDGRETLRDRAHRAALLLGERGRHLILLLGASWNLRAIARQTAGWPRAERAREFLDGILAAPDLSVVLFSSLSFELPESAAPTFDRVELAPLRIRPELIDEPKAPAYAEAARALRSRLIQKNLVLTPLQLRVAVGLVALGERIEAVMGELETLGAGGRPSSSLGPLERRLEDVLARPALRPLREGLVRLAQARYPLPRKAALELAHLPPEHELLVVDCIGFGNGTVRMNEFVRRAIGQGGSPETAEAHDELAAHHRSLDGTREPATIERGEAMVNWLEKVHHLAHGRDASRAEWSEQDFRSRDFYWDLAWALSYLEKRYEEAAEVYRRAVECFGEDSYSCHYLAFNLDRAGIERQDAERLYRRAVELDPRNPWWNGRLINFLIDQARFDAARDEWFHSLDRVDPDREFVGRDSWMATQFHRWVVVGWLEAGEVERAREAFDEIPRAIVQSEDSLLDLENRLLDAEEARALGESVYPADTPFDQRWTGPRVVPARRNQSALASWYPGRVALADDKRVDLVVATPATSPEERRVIYRSMPRKEWEQSGWCPAAEARGFVEVGVYEGGSIVVLPVVGPSPIRGSSRDHLRYLRRW